MEVKRKRVTRVLSVDAIRNHILDESTSTLFRNARSTLYYSVTPSVNTNLNYQVTVWDQHGPMSDSKHNTADEIIENYESGWAFKAIVCDKEFQQLANQFCQ